MKSDFVINSVGGCGSKYLVKQVIKQCGDTSLINRHKHESTPCNISSNVDKVVFVYGDVFLSVASFFNRRRVNSKLHGFNPKDSDMPGNPLWAQEHCKNIGGQFESLDTTWGLTEFLDNGVDLFGLKSFYENWLLLPKHRSLAFDICYVRYESFKKTLPSVLNFLNLNFSVMPDDFVQRGSGYTDFSAEHLDKLNLMYGDIQNTLLSLPDFFIVKSND